MAGDDAKARVTTTVAVGFDVVGAAWIEWTGGVGGSPAWLTVSDREGDVELTRDDVRRLLPYLAAFAETGRIEGPASTSGGASRGRGGSGRAGAAAGSAAFLRCWAEEARAVGSASVSVEVGTALAMADELEAAASVPPAPGPTLRDEVVAVLTELDSVLEAFSLEGRFDGWRGRLRAAIEREDAR